MALIVAALSIVDGTQSSVGGATPPLRADTDCRSCSDVGMNTGDNSDDFPFLTDLGGICRMGSTNSSCKGCYDAGYTGPGPAPYVDCDEGVGGSQVSCDSYYMCCTPSDWLLEAQTDESDDPALDRSAPVYFCGTGLEMPLDESAAVIAALEAHPEAVRYNRGGDAFEVIDCNAKVVASRPLVGKVRDDLRAWNAVRTQESVASQGN
jgi:hypothetical protein